MTQLLSVEETEVCWKKENFVSKEVVEKICIEKLRIVNKKVKKCITYFYKLSEAPFRKRCDLSCHIFDKLVSRFSKYIHIKVKTA